MTAPDDARNELRALAQGVAAGTIRRSLSDSLVTLTDTRCYDPLGVFDALVEAVDEGDEAGTRRLLDVLVGSVAGESCGVAEYRHVGNHGGAVA